MKIIFAGTPEFSVPPLHALVAGEHEVCAVYTQPDRPAGRGRKVKIGPVKAVALALNIPVYQPASLKAVDTQKVLQGLQADLMVVVAYGLILPKVVLQTPKYGCLNIHASLLPRWRGAAPIQRAILAADAVSGVTIMQMDEGLDTGDMLLKSQIDITADMTTEMLHDRLSALGASALTAVLAQLSAGTLSPEKQNGHGSTYAKKLDKKEAMIDWHQSAAEIRCLVNAFNPWPVAQTKLADKVVRIWSATVLAQRVVAPPGTLSVIDKQLHVATGDGVLIVQRLQMPGGKPISTQDYLNGHNIDGQQFG